MEISDIIFIGIIAVVCIGKVINSTKSQQINTEDINKDTLSVGLDKEECVNSPKTEEPKPLSLNTKVKHTPAIAPKSAKEAPKTAQASSEEKEFDLRKAVVYSEILTPKFKEEDF